MRRRRLHFVVAKIWKSSSSAKRLAWLVSLRWKIQTRPINRVEAKQITFDFSHSTTSSRSQRIHSRDFSSIGISRRRRDWPRESSERESASQGAQDRINAHDGSANTNRIKESNHVLVNDHCNKTIDDNVVSLDSEWYNFMTSLIRDYKRPTRSIRPSIIIISRTVVNGQTESNNRNIFSRFSRAKSMRSNLCAIENAISKIDNS